MLRARARAFRIGISNTGLLLYFGQPGSQSLESFSQGVFLDLVTTKPIYSFLDIPTMPANVKRSGPGSAPRCLPRARQDILKGRENLSVYP